MTEIYVLGRQIQIGDTFGTTDLVVTERELVGRKYQITLVYPDGKTEITTEISPSETYLVGRDALSREDMPISDLLYVISELTNLVANPQYANRFDLDYLTASLHDGITNLRK